MRIIIIGCEYVGKSTLAGQISRWMIRNLGLPSVRWHAHFVLPHLDRHILVPDRGAETPVDRRDDEAILQLPPFLKEQLMRYMIWRHLCNDMYRANDDFLMIDFYYGDAVYAPLYYGYGGSDDAFSDRRKRAREWDTEVMMQAPDTVLVLLRASVDAVRRRMSLNPHPGEYSENRRRADCVAAFRGRIRRLSDRTPIRAGHHGYVAGSDPGGFPPANATAFVRHRPPAHSLQH